MSILALVRHGESMWNLSNRFSGWVDVPLSKNGIREAERTANRLKSISFDVAYTSELERAHATLVILLSRQSKSGIFQHVGGKKYYKWMCKSNTCLYDNIPVFTSDLLNERYYGDLQGMNKNTAVKKFGTEQVFNWRRGYKDKPPNGESLEDTFKRAGPYFKSKIEKALKEDKNVLMAGHGNTLRAVMKQINGFSVKDLPFLNLPKGKPIIYEYIKGKYICKTPKAYNLKRPLR